MLHTCFVHVQTSLTTITKLRIHFSRTKSTDPIGSHWTRPPKSALMFLCRILLKNDAVRLDAGLEGFFGTSKSYTANKVQP